MFIATAAIKSGSNNQTHVKINVIQNTKREIEREKIINFL
jgi:hypothetical protein